MQVCGAGRRSRGNAVRTGGQDRENLEETREDVGKELSGRPPPQGEREGAESTGL